MASRAAAPASRNVDLLIHCRDRETANPRLGEVVSGCPATGYWVKRADAANRSLGDTDSEHGVLRNLLRRAAENVEHVVDGDGEFARGVVSRRTRHLRPALRRYVQTLGDRRRRSIQLVAAEHVEFILPRGHCRSAHRVQHASAGLEVIASGCIRNKHRRL